MLHRARAAGTSTVIANHSSYLNRMEKTPRANLSSAHSALVEQSLRAASSMSTRLMLAQRRFIPLLTVLALPGGCFQTHSISTADSGTRLGRDAPVADSARADAPIHDAAPDDGDAARRCTLLSPSSFLVPLAVPEGDFTTVIPVSMFFENSFCGGTGRLVTLEVGRGDAYALELCDYCETCDCIGPNFEATTEVAIPSGSVPDIFGLGGATAPIPAMVHPARCASPIDDFSSLEALVPGPPDAPFGWAVSTDPRAIWVRVRGSQRVCGGGAPLPMATSIERRGSDLLILMNSCNTSPECPRPDVVPFETNVFVGFHEPGSYRVFAGSRSVRVNSSR